MPPEGKKHVRAPLDKSKLTLARKADEDFGSMEKSAIVLPSGNGVVAIGDLWNCRTNTVEGNLFDKQLEPQYLQADPIQSMSYTLQSCSNTKDVKDIMKISAELSIEFASGGTEIKCVGSGAYEKTDTSNFQANTVVFDYEAQTYQVRALPSAANVVSDRMQELLKPDPDTNEPKVVATHFVQAVVMGGKSSGNLTYEEIVNDSKMHIEGSFQVDLKIGPVDVSAKASFEKLDEEHSSSYKTAISVESQPKFAKAPTKVKDMFDELEKLDFYVERERHFPDLDKKDQNDPENNYVMRVTGVPIIFKLVPISHIMPIEVDEKYKLLGPEKNESYLEMCCALRDMTNPQYIKRMLIERAPKITPILMDDYNPLTERLQNEADAKARSALAMKHESAKIFTQHKSNPDGLLEEIDDLLMRFQTEFAQVDMEAMYREYIREAKQELADIRASDVNGITVPRNKANKEDGDEDEEEPEPEPALKFFSNKVDLDDWYNGERTIKALLRTDQAAERSPTGIFMKLYDLAPALALVGVEVGIAFPNISEGKFTLSYKSSEYETEYQRDEIRYFLEVLSVAVDEGHTIPKIFYSVNAALSGLQLPMVEYLFDVPNLAIVMSEHQDTVICETYCELLARLFETLDTFNFVFPIEGLNSSVEMMRFYRQMKEYLPERVPGLKHKFFVSRFPNVENKHNAPLLLVFYENRFQAVCLDHLDILILIEELRKEEPDFQLLSYGRIREACLYPPRGDWAVSVVQNLSLEHETFKTDPIFDRIEFPNNPDPSLPEAVEMVRVSALRDEPGILTAVAKMAMKVDNVEDELEAVLSKYGWKDGGFSRILWAGIDWAGFLKDMKDFLAGQAPALMKVILAHEELQALDPDPEEEDWDDKTWNEKVNAIIKFLHEPEERSVPVTYTWKGRFVDETDLFKELKEQVAAYDNMPGKARKVGISKLFESFIAKESAKPEIFHIFILTHLVEGKTDEKFNSFKQLLLPVCKRYCARVSIKDEEYPRGQRRLDDYLNERQLFKALSVLSEISFDSNLYLVHQELFNLSTLPAPINVKSLIEKMSLPSPDDPTKTLFQIEQLETIWSNPKFMRALRQVVDNEGVLDALIIHVKRIDKAINGFLLAMEKEDLLGLEEEAKDEGFSGWYEKEAEGKKEERDVGDLDEMPEFPYFIPSDIAEKVKALIVLRERAVYEYPKDWSLVQDMIQAFQIVEAKSVLPVGFFKVLRGEVAKGGAAKEALRGVGALEYWNEEEGLFELPWSWLHVTRYLRLLMEAEGARRILGKKTVESITSTSGAGVKEEGKAEVKIVAKETMATRPGIKVNHTWEKFVQGGFLPGFTNKVWRELDYAPETAPMTLYDKLGESVPLALKYARQALLSGNTASLWAEKTEKLVKYPPLTPGPGQIDFGDGIPGVGGLGSFLTRGDLITALVNLSDSLTSYQVVRALAGRTGVPLPLLVTSIEMMGTPKETVPTKAFFLLELLKDVHIHEMEGILKESRLFRTPYRFVLTLRVGDVSASDEKEKGRSTLLNSHIMKKANFFSSKQEPGSVNGKPLNRNGFLEFTWLSESTCEPGFWTNFVEKQHLKGDLVLLGVLHGDALNLTSLFEVILPYVSTVVVFWKAANFTELKGKRSHLMRYLDNRTRTLDVILYPDSTIYEKVNERNIIVKEAEGTANHIINKNKLQNIMSEAMMFSVDTSKKIPTADPVEQKTSIFASLSGPKGAKPLSTNLPITATEVEPVSTPESKELLDFIEKTTIGDLQDAIEGFSDMALVGVLVEKFVALLNSRERDRGLTHLFWELDRISRKGSVAFYQRIQKVRAQIAVKFVNPEQALADTVWIKETQEEVRISMALLRRNTMNLHDLWRLIFTAPVAAPATLVGDHILAGFPMEMFHPTYARELWGNGVEDALRKSIPAGTKIFVVSAFGLKGSGKSALLNALFGASFTEHSTTFGLQIKLCWLHADLRESLDCDAFLVIDSEGFGAMENRIDEEADSEERALLALLLSISGVSLATVLGPRMEELQDILDLAMFSLSKMVQREGVQPADVLLVQQLYAGQPDNDILATEFNQALSKSVQASKKFELQAGLRMTEAHRLKMVKSRNKHGEVLHKVRSWEEEEEYGADVRKLYNRVLDIALVSRGVRTTFGEWFPLTSKLWEEICTIKESKTEKIFQSKNTAMLATAVSMDEQIANVKKAIDLAFLYHEKQILGKEKTIIDYLFRTYQPNFDENLNLSLSRIYAALTKVIISCEEDAENAFTRKRRMAQMRMAGAVNPNACQYCAQAFPMRETLFAELAQQPKGFLEIEGLNRYVTLVKDTIYERIRQGIIARQLAERKSDGDLLFDLMEIEKTFPNDREQAYAAFLQEVSTMQHLTPATHLCYADLVEAYKPLPHLLSEIKPDPDHYQEEPFLAEDLLAFDVSIYNSALESAMNKRKADKMTWLQHEWLVVRLIDIPRRMKDDFEAVLYKPGMAFDLKRRVQELLSLFQEYCGGEALVPDFRWEVHLYAIKVFMRFILEQQEKWDLELKEDEAGAGEEVKGGNPLKVLREMKEEFKACGDGEYFHQTGSIPPPGP